MSNVKNLTDAGETITTVSTGLQSTIKNITISYLGVIPNHAPTVEDIVINMNWNTSFQFSNELIEDAYSDQESNLPFKFKIVDLPQVGLTKLNGVPVIIGQLIDFTDLDNLSYTPAPNGWGVEYAIIKASVNDKGIAPNPFSLPFNITFNVTSYAAPTIEDSSVCLIQGQTYQFTLDDITVGYQDDDNGSPEKVKILSLPSLGQLLFNDIPVTINQEINVADIELLEYDSDESVHGRPYASFEYSLSSTSGHLFSEPVSMSISVNAIPIVDNSDITVEVEQSINFDDDYFISLFTDIDGDSAQLIKITTLPTKGTLKYQGIDVTLNQIIAINQLGDFNLVYTADDSLIEQSDVISYQIKDSYACIATWSDTALINIDITLPIPPPTYEFKWIPSGPYCITD